MLDLTRCDGAQLDVVRCVATEIVSVTPGIDAQDIMIVGAACRDVLQSALGHAFELRATNDLDVALALSQWEDYQELTNHLVAIKSASNGIRYSVAGLPVDLMPFGQVEDPTGTVTPRRRNEGMSVWAFSEVFEHSLSLPLGENLAVRLPSIPGYAALKLCAWLDRAEYRQHKDASDIATTLFWYEQSDATQDRLYGTEAGNAVLFESEMDVAVAAAHLLGQDIFHVIGPDRQKELAARWPGGHEQVLLKEMNLPYAAEWPQDMPRRREILRGLESGLSLS